MDDDGQRTLIRRSVRQALERPPGEVPGALAWFGWRDLAAADEAFAFTALFEEQGHLAAGAAALDLAAAAVLGTAGDVAVVWPHGAGPGGDPGDDGSLAVAGVALGPLGGSGRPVLVPAGGRLRVLDAPVLEESALGGMAAGTGWRRVRGRATAGADAGSWPALDRYARLALASELVGVTQRILDVAIEHVSARRQFGRSLAANQAVRFRMAEAYAELSGARAFTAAAWEDGSGPAAGWAKAIAGAAHEAVAKHALQVCGAIGLSDEHALPGLVRRGFALDALLGREAPVAAAPADPAAAVGSF